MLILVVDDDPMAAEMTAAILEDSGHQAQTAENGIEALEQIENNADIEMVISDMNMPLLSGLELFSELKKMDFNKPFILLSGDNVDELKETVPDLSACLVKDFSLQDNLIDCIDNI